MGNFCLLSSSIRFYVMWRTDSSGLFKVNLVHLCDSLCRTFLFLALVKLNSGEPQLHICCEIIRWSPGPPLVFIFLIFCVLWDRDQDLHNLQYFEIHHHQVNWKQVTGAWSEAEIFWPYLVGNELSRSILLSLLHSLFSRTKACSGRISLHTREPSQQQWTIINSWVSFKFPVKNSPYSPVERGILPCLGLRNVCQNDGIMVMWLHTLPLVSQKAGDPHSLPSSVLESPPLHSERAQSTK